MRYIRHGPGLVLSVRKRLRCTAIAGGSIVAMALAAGTAEAGVPAGVEAQEVASFDTPTYVAAAPGRPRFLYVTEKSGVVRVMRNGVKLPEPFLDISERVTDNGEQGLLSIAFAPRFRKNRRFYVYFNSSSGCSGGCPILVEEYKARRRNPARARPGSRRRVISIPHPDASNHNGGTIAFGPDGRLWLAPGDGGGGGDQFENARDLGSLLGKLLRITPVRRKPNRPGYRVPRSNPFVGQPGRDEIWSYGLRNPYRFSFDRGLSTVAIGDVGQGTQEELNLVRIGKARGAGFGWPELEGTFDYPESPPYTPPTPPLAPIFTYPNPASGPASVTGGVIAHDPGLPQLEGRYLFADFYAGQIYSFVPDLANNQADDLEALDVAPIPNLVAFAAGLDDQLYVLSLGGPLYRLEPEGTARESGGRGVPAPPVGDGTGGVDFGMVGMFDAPVNVAFAPGEPDNLYVVEQDGTVEALVGNVDQPGTFLDVRSLTDGSGEQGLLGLAFHPSYQANGLVYAYYTDEENGDIVVSEFEAPDPLDADEPSRRQVIRIRHRFAGNHNGGQLLFGPGGLYMGTGDGGSAGDPRENAQNKRSLLGKLLRINPLDPPGSRTYSIPDGNPFKGRKGKDAIFARGLRNPFRFSFDAANGRIAIGDVGQDRFEEVDYESRKTLKNANFGWDRWEGRRRYNGGDSARTPKRKRHDRPIHVYDHGTDGGSCSITGGVVVRDPALTNLYGRYLYADFCAAQLRSFIPKLSGAENVRKLDDTFPNPTSFTTSPFDNRIYVTSLGGNVVVLGPQD